MARKKKLNITDLMKDEKAYQKEKPIKINDKVTLYYAEKFGQTKIDELLTELLETVNFTSTTEGVEEMDNVSILMYLNFLIVKHFTNLQEAMEGLDFYQNIEASVKAYDKGWVNIVIETMDVVELSKVYDKFYDLVRSGDKFIKMTNDAQEELVNTVKSDFLKKKLGGNVGKKIQSI